MFNLLANIIIFILNFFAPKSVSVLTYIFNYLNIDELEYEETFKLIFMIDWKHSIEFGKPLTEIRDWKFISYRYVWSYHLVSTIFLLFFVLDTEADFTRKIKNEIPYTIKLNEKEKNIIDFVLKKYKEKSKQEFTELLSSTYPSIAAATLKSKELNLTKLAKKYIEEIRPNI